MCVCVYLYDRGYKYKCVCVWVCICRFGASLATGVYMVCVDASVNAPCMRKYTVMYVLCSVPFNFTNCICSTVAGIERETERERKRDTF